MKPTYAIWSSLFYFYNYLQLQLRLLSCYLDCQTLLNWWILAKLQIFLPLVRQQLLYDLIAWKELHAESKSPSVTTSRHGERKASVCPSVSTMNAIHVQDQLMIVITEILIFEHYFSPSRSPVCDIQALLPTSTWKLPCRGLGGPPF